MNLQDLSYFSLTLKFVGTAFFFVTCLAQAQPNWGQIPQPVEEIESESYTGEPSQLTIKEIVIEGSTVLSDQERMSLTEPYQGRTLSPQELEKSINELIAAINQLYEEKGYLAFGTYWPRQELGDGILRIRAVEGELEAVEVNQLRRLNSAYVRERLLLAGKTPLNANRL